MRTSALVVYADKASVDNDSNKDISIGFDNSVVGSNSTAMSAVAKGTLLLVHNHKILCIGEVLRKATHDESTCWTKAGRGGRMWSFNFKVKWLTKIVVLTPLVDIIVKELCDYSSLESKKFWHYLSHTSKFRDVVSKLVDRI